MKEYDDYLDKITDEYNQGCKPEIISHNEDNIPDYNCEDCIEKNCIYWDKYNDPDPDESISHCFNASLNPNIYKDYQVMK